MKETSVEGMEKVLAKKIVDCAFRTVKGTVGKSFPWMIHEVKLPDEIRNREDRDVFSM